MMMSSAMRAQVSVSPVVITLLGELQGLVRSSHRRDGGTPHFPVLAIRKFFWGGCAGNEGFKPYYGKVCPQTELRFRCYTRFLVLIETTCTR